MKEITAGANSACVVSADIGALCANACTPAHMMTSLE